MTYEGQEDKYADKLVEVLIEHFGEENVETEVVLPSERILDILVETDSGEKFAIEVEDNWESVYSGHGQVDGYASEIDATPIVAVPVGNVELPELLHMNVSNSDIAIIQIPVE